MMEGKAVSIDSRGGPSLRMSSHPTTSRLWDGLSLQDVTSILKAAVHKQVPANTVIVNQNDQADHFFLLATGSARHFYITEDGQKVLLRWLLPGDVTGGRALLRQRASYLVSTEVLRASSLAIWSRNAIQELMSRYPPLTENVLSLASDYLAWFLASHLALVSHNARERLAEVLISLAEGVGHKTAEGIELSITNEELANASNVTLFTVCRILSGWRRDGALLKSRGKLVLRFPHKILPDLHPVPA
jgi:CRP/FNR family transcriptional regulator, nitrogen oxide reductase regulator